MSSSLISALDLSTLRQPNCNNCTLLNEELEKLRLELVFLKGTQPLDTDCYECCNTDCCDYFFHVLPDVFLQG